MPALLTTASRRPKRSTAVSTIAWPPSGLATESCDATATPPACSISATTRSATPESAPLPDMLPPRSLTTTAAPRRARSRANSRPRPRPAPVTITTCPEKSIMVAATVSSHQLWRQCSPRRTGAQLPQDGFGRPRRLTRSRSHPYCWNDGWVPERRKGGVDEPWDGRSRPVITPPSDELGRFKLIASAIADRLVEVAPVEPGGRPWTDGVTVFADALASPRDQLRCVAVQAALLAAGSLDSEIMRRLARRPMLARRYLAVEGHRALAAQD